MNSYDRITCAEAFRKLDDYVDRELSPEETHLVEAHLEVCVRCATEYRFERQVIDQVRQKLQRFDLPNDLLGKISRRLRGADGPGA